MADNNPLSSPATEILPDELIDAEHIIRTFTFDGADSGRARRALETLMSALRVSQPTGGEEPVALIDTRLTDLAEANALYGKDQRLSAPDKIARNNREISWLKDLRSTILTAATPTAMAQSSARCSADMAALAARLREAAESLHLPPSIQSQKNIRVMNACDEAAKVIEALGVAQGWRDALPKMSAAGRNELAKLVDAEAWMALHDGRDAIPGSMWGHRREWALRKADTILSALPDLYSLPSTDR